ncbi:MAG: flippase-like domain-containing protein [Cyanobacteriota bacterium]|nr:flippase-like domain-containing protein [Cyanobacteriota bacterium]
MAIAVFDVDGTLLQGDCLLMACRRSRGALGTVLAVLICMPWLIAWQLRLIKTGRCKEKVIAAFRICEAVNQAALNDRQDWLLPMLQRQLRDEAVQRLQWHQKRGDRVLLCSASPRLLLQPLADVLGVELLCTELAKVDGLWQPQLVSANCKGSEKVRCLEAHLGPLKHFTIEAYGDSRGDRELLQAAAIPHYRSFCTEPRPYPAFSLGALLPLIALTLLSYGLLGSWSQGDKLLPLFLRLLPQISVGLLLVLVSYTVRYGRWRLLLAALSLQPPIADDARIWMGSYAFTATPGKSGEAVRSWLLKQNCNIPAPPTLMALAVERLTDGTSVLLILLFNLPLLLRWKLPLVLLCTLGLIAVIGFWLLGWGRWLRSLFCSTANKLLPEKFVSASGDGLIALRQLLRPRLLLTATMIGVVAWSLEGLSLWILIKGIGAGGINWNEATIAHTAAGLLGALSLLPGGLGSTEAGTIGLLNLQGVPLAVATPATLLIRLMTIWFATGLGVLCLLWQERRS